MLNDRKLALLNSKLYVPLVIRDILENKETTQDDIHYALHEVISNFQPDAALLCIALSAKHIATRANNSAASLNVLTLECDRIIEDYGYLWLQHAEHKELDSNILFDTLVHVPEDLESLSELLHINSEFLESANMKAAEILNILKIQADAHMIIAESYIEAIDAQDAETAPLSEKEALIPPTALTNNIIAFPGITLG